MNHHFPSISNFPCFLYKNAPKPKICWYCASATEGKREREEVRTCMGGRENKRARLQIGPDVSVASVSGLALGSQGRQATCGPATPQTQPSATSGATELVWRTGDITQTSWAMRIAANVCLCLLVLRFTLCASLFVP